jgi:hypothetical protein
VVEVDADEVAIGVVVESEDVGAALWKKDVIFPE